MKKIFTKLIGVTLGLAMAVGVGVGVAANNRKATGLNAAATTAFSFSRSGSTNSLTDGYEMILTNYKGNADNYQDKNSTVGLDIGVKISSGVIWSTLPDSISLTIKVGGGSAKDPLANNVMANFIDSSGDEIGGTSRTVTTKVETTTGKDYVISMPLVNNVAGVMIHHEKESNYNVRIYSISLSYESESVVPSPELSSISISTAPTKIEYIEGDTFDPTGLIITRTYDDESSDTYSYEGHASDFTFTPSTATELRTEDTSVTIGYGGKTTSQSISVAAFAGAEYALCTSANDLESGARYIITNGTSGSVQAISTEANNNNRRQTSVAVDGNTNRITTTRKTMVVSLGGSNNAWTFLTTNYLGNDGYFESASSGTNNNLLVNAHANEEDIPNNGKFTISFSNNIPVVHANAGNRTYMRHNTSSGLFSLYQTNSGDGQTDVYLWKEYKELSSLSVTGSPSKLSYYDSEDFDPSGITAYEAVYSDSSRRTLIANMISWPNLIAGMTQIKGSYTENGITVFTPTYNITVAEDSLSSVTLSGNMTANYYFDDNWDEGNLVVTAHYASGTEAAVTNDSTFAYYKNSALTNALESPADLEVGDNQTIYVKATYQGVSNASGYSQSVNILGARPGTENNPYTVAQARAAIDAGEGVNGVYATGIVSEIVTAFNSQYGNISYNISANGSTNGDQLEAFRGKSFNGEAFTSENDIKVGATVVIYGNLTKHDSTYEFAADNQLVSYEEPSNDQAIEAFVASASSVATIHGSETKTSNIPAESIAFVDLGLENGVEYTDQFDIGNSTIQFSEGSKYYDTGTGMRVYANGTFTISSDEDISKVVFTWSGSYKPGSNNDYASVGSYDKDTYTWSGNAKLITFTNTDSAQWRLQSVEITYGAFVSVDNIALRFGASIPASSWTGINSLEDTAILDYGVMFLKEATLDSYGKASVKAAFEDDMAVTIKHKGDGEVPYLDGDNYLFTIKVSIPAGYYGDVICAVPFIKVNDTYYFMEEKHESVNSLATYYRANGGSNLSNDALDYLKTAN